MKPRCTANAVRKQVYSPYLEAVASAGKPQSVLRTIRGVSTATPPLCMRSDVICLRSHETSVFELGTEPGSCEHYKHLL